MVKVTNDIRPNSTTVHLRGKENVNTVGVKKLQMRNGLF